MPPPAPRIRLRDRLPAAAPIAAAAALTALGLAAVWDTRDTFDPTPLATMPPWTADERTAAPSPPAIAPIAAGATDPALEAPEVAVPPAPVAVASPVAPATASPAPRAGLRVAGRTPRGDVMLVAGEAGEFRIDAEAASPVHYAWTLDGAAVGRDADTYVYTPTERDLGRSHRVAVALRTDAGQTSSHAWTVGVQAVPIVIAAREPPGERVVAAGGTTLGFAVDPSSEGVADDAFAFTWFRNGERVPGAGGPRVTLDTDGLRDVRVTVTAPGRRSASQRWTVVPETAARATVAPTPAASLEAEVRRWLDAYRNALQAGDVARLQALGAIRPERKAAMAEALEDLSDRDYRVEIDPSSVRIARLPDGRVRVTFTRVDRCVGLCPPAGVRVEVSQVLREEGGNLVGEG